MIPTIVFVPIAALMVAAYVVVRILEVRAERIERELGFDPESHVSGGDRG